MKRCLAALLFAGMLFLALQSSHAASVTLGINNRPISFADVLVEGVLYDVDVMWGYHDNDFVHYNAVYASKPPLFLLGIDSPQPSLLAGDALITALFDISYEGSGDEINVYMCTPSYWFTSERLVGVVQDISGDGGGADGFMEVTNLETDVGYTVWTPIATVPIPSAIWLLGSAMIGLIGFSRKIRKS